RSPLPHFEGAEADEGHLFALGQSIGNHRKDRLHCVSGYLLGEARPFRYVIDKLALVHLIPSPSGLHSFIRTPYFLASKTNPAGMREKVPCHRIAAAVDPQVSPRCGM